MTRVLLVSGGLGVGALLGGCDPGPTATYVVDVTTDSVDQTPGDGVCADSGGDCSLRAAVMEANTTEGLQGIELDPGTYLLSLAGPDDSSAASGDLDLTDDTTIIGRPATIDASGLGDRAFDVRSGVQRILGVTVRGGSAPDGAGVRQVGGVLSLALVTIEDNDSSSPTGAGGFRLEGGLAAVTSSTFAANHGASGAAIGVEDGSLSLVNVTVSGNAGGPAVGVSGGSAVITMSTITANADGGVAVADGSVALEQTIVGTQTSGADCSGDPVLSSGYNLDSDSTCDLGALGDLTADPDLGPLADNGLLTASHRPHLDSPALDVRPLGSGPCDGMSSRDQRLALRPQQETCDIGAIEVLPDEAVTSDCDSGVITPYADLTGADLRNCDLDGADLSGVQLTHASLVGASLRGAVMSETNLFGADLTDADLTDASAEFGPIIDNTTWTNATCPNGIEAGQQGGSCAGTFTGLDCAGRNLVYAADLHNCNLSGEDLSGLVLESINFDGAILDGANLDGANLASSGFFGASMVDASLVGARLDDVDFAFADLTGADLTDGAAALMDPPRGWDTAIWTDATCPNGINADDQGGTCEGTATGVDCPGHNLTTNADLRHCNLSGEDHTSAVLPGADLDDAVLTGTDLSGADLSGATLRRASLVGAALAGTDLSATDLTGATLTDATLDGGVLAEANLDDALADGSSLRAVDFSGVSITQTDFSSADLTDAYVVADDRPFGLATWDGTICPNGRVYDPGSTEDGCRARFTTPDCPARNLAAGVDLRNCNLSGEDHAGVDLTDAILDAAILDGAVFDGAMLAGSQAIYTSFVGTSLRDVDFSGSNLFVADFTGADLTGSFAPAGEPVGAVTAIWTNTVCPNGINADDQGGTCQGTFLAPPD